MAIDFSYLPRPQDVSEEAWRRYWEGIMSLTPAQRLRIACSMSEMGMKMLISGVKSRFPDASPEDLHWHIMEHLQSLNPDKKYPKRPDFPTP